MFESWYLLIFFVFSRGASRCSNVAKLAHGLIGKDQKNKFLLPTKPSILFIFNYFFLLLVLYKVILSMTI